MKPRNRWLTLARPRRDSVRRARPLRPQLEQADSRQLLSGLAAVWVNANTEELFWVAKNGAVMTADYTSGKLQAAQPITIGNVAPVGAGIAADSNGSRLDVYFVDNAGALLETSAANGIWNNLLTQRTGTGVAPAGAGVAADINAPRNYLVNDDDVFFVGNNGAVMENYQIPTFFPPYRPIYVTTAVTPAGVAPAGGGIAATTRSSAITPPGGQQDVFFVGNNGAVMTTFRPAGGTWQSQPLALTVPGVAPAGNGIAAAVWHGFYRYEEDVFVVLSNGKIEELETTGGPWNPGTLTTSPPSWSGSGITAVALDANVLEVSTDLFNFLEDVVVSNAYLYANG